MSTRVEKYSNSIPLETAANVSNASQAKTAQRVTALEAFFDDHNQMQIWASTVKGYVLDNLGDLLVQFEQKCVENGIVVHWAEDAKEANEIILGLCKHGIGTTIVKAKSMATEEIHLNKYLEANGFQPIETDLGEFVVQIDDDVPTHIVTPIIHKNRGEISKSFVRENLGPETTVPEELAASLPTRYQECKCSRLLERFHSDIYVRAYSEISENSQFAVEFLANEITYEATFEGRNQKEANSTIFILSLSPGSLGSRRLRPHSRRPSSGG